MSRRRVPHALLTAGLVVLLVSPAWAQSDDGSDTGQVQTPPQGVTTTTFAGVTTTTLPGATTTTLAGTTPTTQPGTTGTATSSAATVSPASTSPGSTVSVTASGFAPSQTVSITFDNTPASTPSATTNQAGAVSVSVTIPTGASAGTHRIVITGRNPSGGQHQGIGTVTVALAQTGAAENIAMSMAAVFLIALGYHLVEKTRWSRAVSTVGWRGR